MLTDCPDPKETSDFHFRQLRTIRITKENENIPSKSVNFLASASKYGLFFIGMEGGFKVLKLEDVLMLDEDKENRSIEKNCSHCFVPCGTPAVLAVNGSQETLAVCIQTVSAILIYIYSIPAFFDSGTAWQPFCSNTLSSSPMEVRDFVWNPTVEGLFTFCLADGSLHIHEMTGMAIKPISSLQTADTISVCWSPKGKQLVAGKQNGCFTQYKPTLQEVKTVVPPPAFEGGPISVTSICWISNTSFAVVYVVEDAPNLFIVSTPKDSTVVYTNFNDVCLGNNIISNQKYFLHLETLWGILICASRDSIEIAVLGDMPNWVQWDLKEDGKALLPGKDGATHAVGVAVMYSAQRQIVISESESYPPMPIMFLLTNNGLLVSFHMINTKLEAASLVSPSLPLEFRGISKEREFSIAAAVQISQEEQLPVLQVSKAFVAENVPFAIDTPVRSVTSKPQHVNSTSCNMTKNFSLSDDQPNGEYPNPFGKEMPGNYTNKCEANSLQNILGKYHIQEGAQFSAVEKQSELQLRTDNSYRMAIVSEVQSFIKELHDFKQLQNSAPVIDGENDRISLKTFALNLHNFRNDIFEAMQSISSDIYTLKNVLLESFVMVEEACSRERRRNDHSYITMLKERALDPITAKHMQKINRHYQYLRTQLQEVSDRLDQDWITLISNKKKSVRSNPCVSSTEAIYKTIVNNQKIIHNLKRKVDVLLKKTEENQLRNTSKSGTWGKKYHKRSAQEDLSELADEFLLLAKVMHKETGESAAASKKLSMKSQNFLKSFLRKMSSVVSVRPTAVYSSSQSRLLSNAIPAQDLLIWDQEKVSALQLPNMGASAVSEILTPEICSKTRSVKPSENEYILDPSAPVYEPVTPPDAIGPLQSLNKTFTDTGMLVHPLSTNKCPAPCGGHQLLSSTAVMDSTDQDYGLNLSTDMESNRGLPTISSSVAGTKFVSSRQASSEIKCMSASPIFPRTALFTSCIEASYQCSTSNPLITIANHSFTSFEKKGRLWSTSAVPTPSIPESTNPVSSESSQIIVGQESPMVQSSTAISSMSPDRHAPSLTQPVTAVTFQTPSPLPTTLASKNSAHFDPSQNCVLFQKLSNDVVDPCILLENDEFSVTARSPLNTNVNSALDLVDNSSVDSKSPLEHHGIDVQKSVSSRLHDSLISPSIASSDITKSKVLPVTINLLNTCISDTKQTESSDSLVSESSVIFTPVSLVKTTPQPTTVTSAETVNLATSTDAALIFHSNPVTAVPPMSTTHPPVTTTVSTTVSLFGQNVNACSPIGSESSSEAVKNTTESSDVSTFGLKATLFEKSFFPATQTKDVPAFGETSLSKTGSLGQTSNFNSVSDRFFSQKSDFGTPTTGAAASVTNSDLNVQASAFSFGQTEGSFGLAKSLFGQNMNPVTQTETPLSFSFGQNSNLVFGGQGSFFGGPGGKVGDENATKNVFGINSGAKSADTNLFKNSGVTSFGTVNNSGMGFSSTGSFSSGGGSVSQSGFGSFQISTAQQPGGFGTVPAFGNPPAFGSAPSFGASPTFGSGHALSSVFSQQQVTSNFSNFANASSPTFGSLASQSPDFSSPAVIVGGGSFGSQGSPPAFGSLSFGDQTSTFGSPGSPPSNSSAFTQWRN